jgi:hypothetical protein
MRFSDALTWRDRATRSAGAAALGAGGARFLTSRLTIPDGGPETIEGHLSVVLGYDVIVSLGLGSLRANQKPVLNVFDARGRSVAFAKVGDSEVSRGLVAREAEAVADVGSRSWKILQPPRLLHFGTWNGLSILLISALPTQPLPRLTGRGRTPVTAMDELSNAYDEGEVPLALTAWWARLMATAEHLQDLERRAALVGALHQLQDSHGERAVRLGAWHGDWTPWNMSSTRQSVLLWDWERFEKGVPVGLDRAHFTAAVAARKQGWSRSVLIEALDGASGSLGTADAPGPLTAGLYLAAITARYLDSEQGDKGDAIRSQAGTALETLQWWLDHRITGAPRPGRTHP